MERIRVVRRVHLRYEGTDSALIVIAATLPEMQAAFDAEYLKRYSFLMQRRGLIIEAVSVEAIGGGDAPAEASRIQANRAGSPRSEGCGSHVQRLGMAQHAALCA